MSELLVGLFRPNLRHAFQGQGSHLERYAARFNAVEINSSFYRPHRRATYERWAASVPTEFRFSVKLPKEMTHERRLRDCDDLVERFAEQADGLGEKLGPILVQLPPSFLYSHETEYFFEKLIGLLGKRVVLEPRHRSWFEPVSDQMLAHRQVARVAADPSIVPAAGKPAGWKGIAYFRLHGSPEIYRSTYRPEQVEAQAGDVISLAADADEVWTIYDNTTLGAAFGNAFQLTQFLS